MTALGKVQLPPWLVLVLAIVGGGGSGSVGATLFGESKETQQVLARVELDVEAHKTRLAQHDTEIAGVAASQGSQLRWLADVLVKQSAAIGQIGDRVGVRVDVAVPQYIEAKP